MKQMFEQESNEIEINLRELYIVLKRNLLKIILVTVLFAGIVGSYTKYFITPTYSSTAELYIVSSEDGQQLYNLTVGDQLAQDYIRLVTTKTVLQTVIDDLDLDMDYHELQSKVIVENPEETRFMTITVTDSDPKQARDLAQRVAVVTSRMVSNTMDVPAPTIVDAAEEPETPDSPNVSLNAIVGGFIGLVLAISVIIFKVVLNDTINDEDDIERYLGINMLAKLPSEHLKRNRKTKKQKDLYKKL